MKSKRLLSLDILRGITMAGMILVNNPGDWGEIYAPLKHAEWNGLTPTDLVFPFFMFVMGVSMSFSLSKFNHTFTYSFWKKLVRRTLILFLLGMLISWFSLVIHNGASHSQEMTLSEILFPLKNIRILGVLQRLALTYFFGSILIMSVSKKKLLIGISACILTLYYILLKAGHGFELSNNNIVAILDQNLWGNSHMYREWLPSGGHLYFDPEGLLSTLPCIAHVTIGFLCGEIIQQDKSLDKRLLSLTITGITLLFSGYLLSYGCPVIKKVWSPTYVLITCGLAYLTLVLLTWIIDINKKSKWCLSFQAFGTNPLFIYIVASLLATILEVPIFGIGITEIIYTTLYNFIGIPKMASLVYALLYITINGSLAYILFKKRIFIKI